MTGATGGLSSDIKDTTHSYKESRMTNWMGMALVGLMSVGMLQSHAETTVTLPSGAGEHFTVQDATSNALLRVNAASVLTGTNVALGTMGSTITLQAGSRAIGTIGYNDYLLNIVLGSNNVSGAVSSLVIGHGHSMYNGAYASIWGGKDNTLTYHYPSSISPYFSAIVGGNENKIWGAQNSVILCGSMNQITNASNHATLLGGYANKVMANMATVVGGRYNEASGTNSFAAGYYARAAHAGSFVWADSSVAVLAESARENEMVIRATNGVRLISSLGTNSLPDKRSRFADNNIVAWGRVIKDDGLAPSEHFGVYSVTNTAQGTYVVSLDCPMQSAFNLIPMAVVEVDSGMMPTNAARARNIYVDQTTGTTNFTVYITDGNHSLTNNDFLFMVTGR